MTYIQILGIVAAIITTAAFLPQAIKVIRTKETKDLSLSMYTLLFIGICLWLYYGILMKDIAIILANSVTGIFAGIILILKIRYK